MKLLKFLAVLSAALSAVQGSMVKRSNPQGIDVSSYQTDVNWNDVKKKRHFFRVHQGYRGNMSVFFFFEHRNTNVMDTPAYKSPEFNSQYTGATNAGIIRGAYHFARPDISNDAEQAKYFAANGGWHQLYGPFILIISCQVVGPATVSPYLERLTSSVSASFVPS